MSLVVKVSASRPGSLEFESRMSQWDFSLPKPIRIGAVKAFDPEWDLPSTSIHAERLLLFFILASFLFRLTEDCQRPAGGMPAQRSGGAHGAVGDLGQPLHEHGRVHDQVAVGPAEGQVADGLQGAGLHVLGPALHQLLQGSGVGV